MIIVHIISDLDGGIGSVVLNLIKLQNKYAKVYVLYKHGNPFKLGKYCIPVKVKYSLKPSIIFGMYKIPHNFFQINNEKTVLHFHNFDSLGLLNVFRFKRKSILTLHGIRINNNNFIRNHIFRSVLKLFLILLKKSNFIVTSVSNKTKEFYEKIVKLTIHVIYNGISIDSSFNYETSKIFRVGFLGDLSINKGFNIFLKLAALNVNNPNLIFIFAGRQNSNSILKDLPVNTINLGYINEPNKFFFNKIDLLVLPSISEGLPMVLIEAQSFGIPVIATNVGGIPEIIIDKFNGFIVNRDEIQISNLVNEIFLDSKLYSEMKINSKKTFLTKFKQELMVEKYIELYNKLK